jgi:hypothetical protein
MNDDNTFGLIREQGEFQEVVPLSEQDTETVKNSESESDAK